MTVDTDEVPGTLEGRNDYKILYALAVSLTKVTNLKKSCDVDHERRNSALIRTSAWINDGKNTCFFCLFVESMKHVTFEKMHFTTAVMAHKFKAQKHTRQHFPASMTKHAAGEKKASSTFTNRHLRAKSVTLVIKATANAIRQFFV